MHERDFRRIVRVSVEYFGHTHGSTELYVMQSHLFATPSFTTASGQRFAPVRIVVLSARRLQRGVYRTHTHAHTPGLLLCVSVHATYEMGGALGVRRFA